MIKKSKLVPCPFVLNHLNYSKKKEKQLVGICQVPFEPVCNKLQQSLQTLYDPTADMLNEERNQNSSPLIDHEGPNQDDNGCSRQALQSVKISS